MENVIEWGGKRYEVIDTRLALKDEIYWFEGMHCVVRATDDHKQNVNPILRELPDPAAGTPGDALTELAANLVLHTLGHGSPEMLHAWTQPVEKILSEALRPLLEKARAMLQGESDSRQNFKAELARWEPKS